jgi:hypothetical protein
MKVSISLSLDVASLVAYHTLMENESIHFISLDVASLVAYQFALFKRNSPSGVGLTPRVCLASQTSSLGITV